MNKGSRNQERRRENLEISAVLSKENERNLPNFGLKDPAALFSLRGSGHEVFCNRITALLSRSRALSRAFVVQRFLSDLGPHDNIVQRLYQLSTRGNILLDLGSIKEELFISFQCTIHTPFFSCTIQRTDYSL